MIQWYYYHFTQDNEELVIMRNASRSNLDATKQEASFLHKEVKLQVDITSMYNFLSYQQTLLDNVHTKVNVI